MGFYSVNVINMNVYICWMDSSWLFCTYMKLLTELNDFVVFVLISIPSLHLSLHAKTSQLIPF